MKKHMTLALAASMLFFTLAATPHRAMASTEIFLRLDGISDASTTQYSYIANALLIALGL